MKTSLGKTLMMSAALAMMLDLSACAKNPASGEHTIQLQFGSYSTAQSKTKTPWLKLLEVNQAQAAVTSLKMCFKRLRFKAADEDTASPDASDNVDLQIGEITVSSAGASLGAVTVPEGTYRRIEFDLDSHCASGKSLQLVNGNGSFSTNQTMTIKFSGSFDADSDGTLTLGVQSILDALNSYNGSDLKVAAEGVSGELRN